MQVPEPMPVTWLPLTVQMLGVVELKVTASLEVAVALTVVVPPTRRLVGLKEIVPMVWLCSDLTVEKLAVTLLAAVMLTMQVSLPLQAPLHPEKLETLLGVAVRVTEAPPLKLLVQVALLHWLIPDGLLVTTPLPVPVSLTVRT